MASSSTVKRLLSELKNYTNNPNEHLLHLGLVDNDDLFQWEAVLKGVKGTPYEGTTFQPTSAGPPRFTTRSKNLD